MQRRLEEMYILNSFQAQSSSKSHKSDKSSADFFPDLNTIKQGLKGSSKDDPSLGNSSASLLAKLQELATPKSEKDSSRDQLLCDTHKQTKVFVVYTPTLMHKFYTDYKTQNILGI